MFCEMEMTRFTVLCFVLVTWTFSVRSEKCSELRVSLVTASDRPSPTLLRQFNVTGHEGQLRPETTASSCYIINITVVKVDNDVVLTIYNESVRQTLQNSEFALGEDIAAMRAYARIVKATDEVIFYFITTPVSLSTEEDIVKAAKEDEASYTLVFWPSSASFINAVVGNVILQTSNVRNTRIQVLLIVYSETEDHIIYVGKLADELRENKFQVSTFDLRSTVREFHEGKGHVNEYRTEFIFGLTLKLRTIMEERDNHFVLFSMEAAPEQKIDALKFLFDPAAGLDTGKATWLIADILFSSQKVCRDGLNKLQVLRTEIIILDPCLKDARSILECFDPDEISTAEVETKGLQAGKEFISALSNGRDPLDLLTKTFIWYYCDTYNKNCTVNSPTVYRPGFPRHDFIVGWKIDPGFEQGHTSSRLYSTSIYYGNGTEKAVTQYIDESQLSTVQIKDYTIKGVPTKSNISYLAVIQDKPFVIKQNATYTGMAIDIYNAITVKLLEIGIKLELEYRETSVYGSVENGRWTGVFGHLSNDSLHTVMALGQIAITEERLADKRFTFSPVFGHAALTYMSKKLSVYDAYLQFLRPFTGDVWLALCAVFILSGVYLRILDAWNPLNEDVPEESKFNWKESMWHSYLVITQMGAPFGAVHLPARVFSVTYWFFALVVVGCYTGNLAGFLTESRMMVPDIVNLVNEHGYQFGMLTNSSISAAYFHHILGRSAQDLHMGESRMTLVDNYEQGVAKVRDEKFILLGTSLVMKAYSDEDEECALHISEGSFYGKQIQAIAFPMRSDWVFANKVKWVMNQLKETGELQLIYHKWLSSSSKCGHDESKDDHTRLDWANFKGLYVLTALGVVVSYLILAIKLCSLKMKEMNEVEDVPHDSHDVELAETKAV